MTGIDRRDRIKAFRLVAFQAVVVIGLALFGLVFQSQIALSLLTGGAIGVVGSAWLAFVVFRPSATRPAKEILISFYLGEIGKFLIVITLLVAAFKQLELLREPRNALMLFSAFFISQLAIVFAPRGLKQN